MTHRRLLIAGLLLAGLIATASTLVTSEMGARWSLTLVQRALPELQLGDIRGSWSEGLHISTLNWQSDALGIKAETLHLQFQLSQLLHSRLALTSLTVERLTLSTPTDTGAGKTATQLTDIRLPFGLELRDLRIGELQWQNTELPRLMGLQLQASWSQEQLTLRQFSGRWDGGAVNSRGSLTLTGDYPLTLQGELSLKELPEALSLDLNGDLRSLSLRVDSNGPWPLRLIAQLDLLDPELPLEARLQNTGPITLPFGGQGLLISGLDVTARGSRQALTAEAHLNLKDPLYGSTQLTFQPKWQAGQLELADIHWLFPDEHSPVGADCVLSAEGDWQCHGSLNQLPLQPLLGLADSQVSGDWQASGDWHQPLAISARLDRLEGSLSGTPLRGQMVVSSDDGQQWRLQELFLLAGDNQIQASGLVGHQNQLQASLNLKQLAQLHPEWRGQLRGELKLEGSWQELNAHASLQARQVETDRGSVAEADLKLDIARAGSALSGVTLNWKSLRIGDLPALSASLKGSGTRNSLNWRLTARDTLRHALSADCEQKLQGVEQLTLSCPQLLIQRADGEHSLALAEHPLELLWQRRQGHLQLAASCLREPQGSGRLCLEESLAWQLGTLPSLRVSLEQLPSEWLLDGIEKKPRILPGSRINASLTVTSWQPLEATGQFQLPRLSWQWPRAHPGTPPAQVERLEGSLQLREDRAALSARARSSELGELSMQLQVQEPRGQAKLAGKLQASQLQLGAFYWLWPEGYQFQGSLDTSIALSGTIKDPRFNGSAQLRQGSLQTAALPVALDGLTADLQFGRQRIGFDARFQQSQGPGLGRMQGELKIPADWQQWQLSSSLNLEGLQLSPLPDSTVVASADLKLNSDTRKASLKGRIDVDSADIQFKQLPPNIQRVSSDAEFVDQDENAFGRQINGDLTVHCTEDCRVRGFGADVYLGGALRLQQQPGRTLSALGTVKVIKGRYRAYGQRLTVRRGLFNFRGPLDNPDIDLEAIRDMPRGTTVTVGVHVAGPLQGPRATLFSEPDMPPTDQTFYLLTGKAPPSFDNRTPVSAESALLAIGLAGTNERAARVAERFGITDFQISGATSEESSEAQVSGYLSSRLYVSYGSDLREGTATVTFQYHLTRSLLVEAVTGFRQSLDLLYTFSID